MTEEELAELAEREARIEKHELGVLVITEDVRAIHDKALFRAHKTFEKYVRRRWGWTRARAYQLIDAAVVAENLSTRVYVPQPKNERQLRPLAGFSPDEQFHLWSDAVEQAGGGDPKASEVAKVVKAYVAAQKAEENHEEASESPVETETAFDVAEAWGRVEGFLNGEVRKWPEDRIWCFADTEVSNFTVNYN